MKILFPVLLSLSIFGGSMVEAQEQSPFIFTAYGGLFFPSNVNYKDMYQSTNDLLWGFGAAYPVEYSWYLSGDVGFFRSEGLLGAAKDSNIALEERFIHLGILKKTYLGKDLFARISAGMNYVTIKQKTSSLQTPEQTVEAENKTGYFGGIGIEQLLEGGHAAIFADIVYDYRRVHQKELEGDFGGVRLVVGLHIILF